MDDKTVPFSQSGKKVKFVLHIGTEKTGSTSIQAALRDGTQALDDAGYRYYLRESDDLNARRLAVACASALRDDEYYSLAGIAGYRKRLAFRAEVFAEFRQFAAAIPAHVHTVVISSEHFHSRLKSVREIMRLRRLLQPHASGFQIVCYLRRQADVLCSLYSTVLRGGTYTESFEHFVRSEIGNAAYYDYAALLARWERVFPDAAFSVRRYDSCSKEKGGVLSDFSEVCGVPQGVFSADAPQENRSLNHVGQACLRGINRAFSARSGNDDAEIHRRMIVGIAENFAGKGRGLLPAQMRDMEAEYRDGNEAVRAKFFPDSPRLFDDAHPADDRQILTEEQEKLLIFMLAELAGASNLEVIHQLSKKRRSLWWRIAKKWNK